MAVAEVLVVAVVVVVVAAAVVVVGVFAGCQYHEYQTHSSETFHHFALANQHIIQSWEKRIEI